MPGGDDVTRALPGPEIPTSTPPTNSNDIGIATVFALLAIISVSATQPRSLRWRLRVMRQAAPAVSVGGHCDIAAKTVPLKLRAPSVTGCAD